MEKTILLVEDHEDSRELLVDVLEFENFAVLQAADGKEGEEIAKAKHPDLILLDLSLPTKSGIDVARALREDPSTKDIPIIALTAHARTEDENQALEVGCTAFLSKPVKPRVVIEQIKRLLAVENK